VDDNDCSVDVDVVIDEQPEELYAEPEITAPVPCNGGDATVAINAEGGTQPYKYVRGGNEQANNVFYLPYGTHTITVVDGNDCEFDVEVDIIEPEELTATYQITEDIQCHGGNATVAINANGGTLPYKYVYGGNEQASNVFELPFGSYTITVVDASDCFVDVNVVIDEQPDELEANYEITAAIQCYGENATVEINATGGTQPYTYWYDGDEFDGTIDLPLGTYTITVIDDNDCEVEIEVVIDEQPDELTATYQITAPILCYGEDATVTIYATGGTEPYKYYVDGENEQSSDEFILPAGNYTITVVDDNDCFVDVDVVVTQPDEELYASYQINEAIKCYGGNATVAINATGGTYPYTYLYNDEEFDGFLPYGTHTITVVDDNGCEYDVEVDIDEQPDELYADYETTVHILCYGQDATVEINPTGGTQPYTYWNGATQVTKILDLSAGDHTITVKDDNDCTFDVDITITQPDAEVEAGYQITEDIKCYGGNATVVINATGGTGTLTYWYEDAEFDGTIELPFGEHEITVKDDNECAVIVNVDVNEQPDEMYADYYINVPIKCYGGNATVEITATGGTGTLTYWKGTTQVSNPLELPFGVHTITVKDENNCTFDLDVNVDEQPDEVFVEITALKKECKDKGINVSATSSQMAIIRIEGYGYNFNNNEWDLIPELSYETDPDQTKTDTVFNYTPGYDYIKFIATAVIGVCEYSSEYTESINHGNLPLLYVYPISKYAPKHDPEINKMDVADNTKIVHYFYVDDYCKTGKDTRLAVNYSYWWRENEEDTPIKVYPISDYLYQAPGTGVVMNFSTEMPCISAGATVYYNYVNNQGHFPYEGGWFYQTGYFNFFRLTFFDQREITVSLSGFTKPGIYTVEYELVTHTNPAVPTGLHGNEYSVSCGGVGNIIGGNGFYSGKYIEKILARRTMTIVVTQTLKPTVTEARRAEVMVYPNPTIDGSINLQFENVEGTAQVRVMTINGITVVDKKINVTEGADVGISIPGLKPGIYFVNIISDNAVLTRKLIVGNR